MGELPLFPLLIKREGADVSPFRIKKPLTISPTTPHSTRAVRGRRGGYGVRYGVTQTACASALFWAWPNSARHRVWSRPGGSCRCTRVGVPRTCARAVAAPRGKACRATAKVLHGSLGAIQEQSIQAKETRPRQEELARKANQGISRNLPRRATRPGKTR